MERFSTAWNIPDFDKDEWYDDELRYHQRQAHNFGYATRALYGENPEKFQAQVSTEPEIVTDIFDFFELDGGQVSWISAEHMADRGMMEMEYTPPWIDNSTVFPPNSDYRLELEGTTGDRDYLEHRFDQKLTRTGLNRLKDLKRILDD